MGKALPALFLLGMLCMPAHAQEHEVSGQVMAEEGETLPGVNITVQGTTVGTTTDANGNYSLTAPSPQETLVFSFVGYQTQEVPIEGRSTIDVTLTPRAEELEELVVVGYSQERQGDITGSVSSMSAEDIEAEPVSDFTEAMTGKVSGVNVSQAGWQPSDGTQIRIRGTRSLTAGNDPLLVVNGSPWSGGTLHDIPPSSIASIQVLKGPSATAIYGSRGANGVIQIETKQGSAGDTQVSYSATTAAQVPYKRIDQMNSDEWARMKLLSRELDGLPADSSAVFKSIELEGLRNGVDTDWQDLVLRTGTQNRHELRVSGGTDETQFVIAPSFFQQTGAIKGVNFRRYSVQGDINHQFSDRFEANLSVLGSQTSSKDNFARQGAGGNLEAADTNDDDIALINAFLVPPVGRSHDEDGNRIFLPTNDNIGTNPLSEINNLISEYRTTRLFGTLDAQYDLLPSLSYRAEFSPDIQYRRRGGYWGSNTRLVGGGDPQASQNESRQFHYTFNNVLQYNNSIGDHSLNATGLYSFERESVEGLTIIGEELPYNSSYYGLGTAAGETRPSSSLSEWTLHSLMGRVNYSFQDTYMLTLTTRYDGSSRLAEGNKWNVFPSGALGLRISNMSFMEPLEGTVSNLMVRVEYGESGNTSIPPYGTLGGLNAANYIFGDNGQAGFEPTEQPNPNLTWENTSQINVGLDFGFLDERVTGAIDLYRQETENLLQSRSLPPSLGASTILQNVGSTENRGVDVSLSTVNVQTDDFQWTTDMNFSMNRTEITSLPGGEDDLENEWFIGEPINVHFDEEFDGIWQQDEAQLAQEYGAEPGDIRVVDVNGDTAIGAADRQILGSPNPKWTAGLTSTLRYGGVDLSFSVNTEQGRLISNGYRTMAASNFDGRFNSLDVNYWVPPNSQYAEENPSNEWPRPSTAGQEFQSSLGYVDGSYVRIQNVTLGYRLPSAVTEPMGARTLRLYATVRNPYVFTQSDRFIGYDPDGAIHPQQAPSYRTFLFGVDLQF